MRGRWMETATAPSAGTSGRTSSCSPRRAGPPRIPPRQGPPGSEPRPEEVQEEEVRAGSQELQEEGEQASSLDAPSLGNRRNPYLIFVWSSNRAAPRPRSFTRARRRACGPRRQRVRAPRREPAAAGAADASERSAQRPERNAGRPLPPRLHAEPSRRRRPAASMSRARGRSRSGLPAPRATGTSRCSTPPAARWPPTRRPTRRRSPSATRPAAASTSRPAGVPATPPRFPPRSQFQAVSPAALEQAKANPPQLVSVHAQRAPEGPAARRSAST